MVVRDTNTARDVLLCKECADNLKHAAPYMPPEQAICEFGTDEGRQRSMRQIATSPRQGMSWITSLNPLAKLTSMRLELCGIARALTNQSGRRITGRR